MLPGDLLLEIFQFLDSKDLGTCELMLAMAKNNCSRISVEKIVSQDNACKLQCPGSTRYPIDR